MKATPHAKHRNNWMIFLGLLIAATIVYGCTKGKSKDWMEVLQADKSVKDSVDKWQGWFNEDEN